MAMVVLRHENLRTYSTQDTNYGQNSDRKDKKMKYYINENKEVYAYDDNEKPLQDGLTPIDEAKLNEILHGEANEQAEELAELEHDIAECENYIRHALIIGNDKVLENLRAELKELIEQREELRK